MNAANAFGNRRRRGIPSSRVCRSWGGTLVPMESRARRSPKGWRGSSRCATTPAAVVLQRPHPPPRPRSTRTPAADPPPPSTARAVRSVQLRQGSTRLARPHHPKRTIATQPKSPRRPALPSGQAPPLPGRDSDHVTSIDVARFRSCWPREACRTRIPMRSARVPSLGSGPAVPDDGRVRRSSSPPAPIRRRALPP